MHFNNTLLGLDTQATIAFPQTTLKVKELQYGLDVAMTSGLVEQFLAAFQLQGLVLSPEAAPPGTMRRSPTLQLWTTGLPCVAFQPGYSAPINGTLRLRVGFEFVPETQPTPAHRSTPPS